MAQKNTTQTQTRQIVTKVRKPRPGEFLTIMARISLIEQEVKAETALYDLKIRSLELEKQYLWHQINPGQANQ